MRCKLKVELCCSEVFFEQQSEGDPFSLDRCHNILSPIISNSRGNGSYSVLTRSSLCYRPSNKRVPLPYFSCDTREEFCRYRLMNESKQQQAKLLTRELPTKKGLIYSSGMPVVYLNQHYTKTCMEIVKTLFMS